MLSTEVERETFDATVDGDDVETEVASSGLDVGEDVKLPDGVCRVERVRKVRVFQLVLDPIERVFVSDADVANQVAGRPDRSAEHLNPKLKPDCTF